MLLEPIYEQVFLDCSFGFRPARNAHQAIQEVRTAIMERGGRPRWPVQIPPPVATQTPPGRTAKLSVFRVVWGGSPRSIVFACLFWFYSQRLFGKRSASGRRHRPRSGGPGHKPRRGCPQAPSCGAGGLSTADACPGGCCAVCLASLSRCIGLGSRNALRWWP